MIIRNKNDIYVKYNKFLFPNINFIKLLITVTLIGVIIIIRFSKLWSKEWEMFIKSTKVFSFEIKNLNKVLCL